MALTETDTQFLRSVADEIDSVVIARCTQGRWMSGQGLSQDTASTMRAVQADGIEYMLGTAIAKQNQRAMMASQPEVLRNLTDMLRSAPVDTPAPLSDHLVSVATMYNKVMGLRVPAPAPSV